ncbi:MAG: metalloregulator ArsR/SmtB family transcription factor [Brevinematales bacterium]|nr:metalloregulator ArsR/SmtB family transcription factor [Brevinematales bacterium]
MERSAYSPEEMRVKLEGWFSRSEEAASLLKAMGHPVRVLMLQIISQSQCNVTSIEKALGISQSSASQHLRVLRLAGLIEPVRDGKEICYHIVDERVRKVLEIFYS